MAENSKIEWTDHTFNPWWGCVECSEACAHCYAKAFAKRVGWDVWGPDKERRFFTEDHWNEPLKWDEAARLSGKQRRVFSGSMCDIFEDYKGPDREKLKFERWRLWDLITVTPHLDWLLLTKRPENMDAFTPESWCLGWPANVVAMTTVENQEQANIRIPHLLSVPANRRGLSCEPLLGAIDLTRILLKKSDAPERGKPDVTFNALAGWNGGAKRPDRSRIHWVIAGGESGPKARPMHPAWARSLRDQCVAAGVAFHFKQWGEWAPDDCGAAPHLISRAEIHAFDDHGVVFRVSKKAAGRLLDGREWNEFPSQKGVVLL
jgi:protein gp37